MLIVLVLLFQSTMQLSPGPVHCVRSQMRSRLDRLRQRREDARREKYIADVQKVLKGAR